MQGNHTKGRLRIGFWFILAKGYDSLLENGFKAKRNQAIPITPSMMEQEPGLIPTNLTLSIH